ncbi:DUF6602 domain-containing protein [Vibrio metschnikovii]|uniref:DUF6602 domain-containing protein n=1 Tax=Vibrio metschnikovii TaxID=28172 RepID=UPI001C2F7568|nr:DUF6602 domain-containing protein [Vibrio metschnikovii]
MTNYFELVSQELLGKLAQIKAYITKHNPTIGVLTEEIVRDFLSTHLPNVVSVEQGFILYENGNISKQVDILIYDSQAYAPFYRINDIVVVPAESVIAVIEVKTSITKQIFHSVIKYFEALDYLPNAKTYLFMFNSKELHQINSYFHNYKHKGDYQLFDYDTFQYLPDEITGINSSFHLKKSDVISERDMLGYISWFYQDSKGTEINALQHFYMSIYTHVEHYLENNYTTKQLKKRSDYHQMNLQSVLAIRLFDM